MRMTAATFQNLYAVRESVAERYARENSKKAARKSMEAQGAMEVQESHDRISAQEQLRATGRARVHLAPAAQPKKAPSFIPALIRV